MSKFTPYTIRHLQVAAISEQDIPATCALCYFWWKEIPLGHIWTEGGISLSVFKALAYEVIEPTLQYYLKYTEQRQADEWKHLFLENNSSLWADKISAGLQPFLLLHDEQYSAPISVVICTRNRAESLDKCMLAISRSSDLNFELVVVDNASDDNSTMDVVSRYPFAKYVNEPRKGLDIARNTGARSAVYSIIAYTDDDVIVEEHWIKKIKQCFVDPMTMSVTGQVIPVALQTKAQFIFERYWGFNKGYQPKVFDHKYFLDTIENGVPVWDIGAGANMAFRKEVFEVAGWFDDRLDVGAAGCSGDSEIWYRILAGGWNCYYCPQVYVYHNHRDSEEALKNQVFHYMRGQIASLYVQHENYGHIGNIKRIQNILPRYYFKRILSRIFKGNSIVNSTVFTEIKGCISGHYFYQSVKNSHRIHHPLYDSSLNNNVIISDTTIVSVIITCYNYGRFLQQAIDSALCQTHKHIEVIVVDDGSVDNTADVAAQYNNVKYVKVQRVGLSAARNIGIQYCTGKYLIFLDADDYLYPNAVELNLYYFSYYPKSVFISGGHNRVNSVGEIIQHTVQETHLGNNYYALLAGNYIGMEATVMYRRELFFAFHFNTQLSVCEDYELNINIARTFPTFSHSEKIAAYRIHDGSMSKNKKLMLATVTNILKNLYNLATTEEEKQQISSGIVNWEEFYHH